MENSAMDVYVPCCDIVNAHPFCQI